MKKIFYSIATVLLLFPSLVSAQSNLRSGYFLDGYIYKYKMNPAMAPERGFFAFPALGNLGIGLETNLGLSTFLYPTDEGSLTTFLSPRVPADVFLNRIGDNNKLNSNIDMGLIALGFRTGKSFHTLDLSVRADVGMNIPGGLFEYIKAGGSSWDISNIGMRTASRAELAYGYSRSIGRNLRVGARAKLLLGIVRADIAMDKMRLDMNEERWLVEAHGSMHMAAPFSLMTRGESGNSESEADRNIVDWTAINTDGLAEALTSPSMGFALDLGATYDFLKYFTASFSVLDLGVMSWKNSMTAETPETAWTFEGFETLDTDQIGEQLTGMSENLMNAFNFERKESGVTRSSALAATINAGIEARMPFYERLSFGLLYTQRIEGIYSWSEGRIAASLAPVNWFSLTTNYAFSNFGHSWGGAINLHLPGLGIFVGLDSFSPLLNLTPQYIPVDALNTNLALGVNFTFGRNHGRYAKKMFEEPEMKNVKQTKKNKNGKKKMK